MPCSVCNHSLILFDKDLLCPKCKGLALLDPITAIVIWERRLQYLTDLYNKELSKWDVDLLLGNILAIREECSRKIIQEYGVMEFGKFAIYTILLDRIIRHSLRGGKVPQSRIDVTNLVNIFEKILNAEDELLKLKSCYGDVMYLEPFDLDDLNENMLFGIFNFVENEKYNRLRKTAAIYDIYSESEAKEIMDKYRAEEHETSTQLKYKHFEPPEFIQSNFKILNAIYAIFLRNTSYAEVFGRLREYKRLMKSPNTLMEFVWRFRFVNDNVQAICPTNEFIRRAAQFFKESKDKVKDILVYDRYNKSIFPLFVKFQTKELGNTVFISHRFSFFIHTFLHSILTEDLFNAETEKRSLQFEKLEVKSEFEKNKFLYFPDIVDRKDATFQIDGLAIKGRTCYVVECKGWRLNKFMDEKRNRDQIIRDLKGIVIGEKYTTKNQLIITRKTPSLVKKIEYVKNNLHRFIADNTKVTIEGLVVTISYSPITEYEGIKFISIEEVCELR